MAATGTQLDMNNVRSRFPALQSGNQVYFDNAGGSQALGTVADRIRDYLLTSNVQLGASYATGRKATTRYKEGYEAAARYINAKPSDIVLGPSTTTLFRTLSFTLRTFAQGDEIILSILDHEANIAPWVDLADRLGLFIKWWPSSDASASTNPKLTPENLRPLLSSRTRLIACTHASNILGTIHDIPAIARKIRASDSPCPDAILCVDAVAYAPHRRIDVQTLGVDVYAFSWYKVYGPHLAMLWAGERTQKVMSTLAHYFNEGKMGRSMEERLGLAGSSYELVSGVPGVVEYMEEDGGKWEGIVNQEAELQGRLMGYLKGKGEEVTIFGERSADVGVRVPTVSFEVRGWGAKEVVETIEAEGKYGFRWGAFYSERLVHRVLGLGKEGVVRISMVHYNTVEEVDGLIDALERLVFSKKRQA